MPNFGHFLAHGELTLTAQRLKKKKAIPLEGFSLSEKHLIRLPLPHKMITEPIFTIFELFSIISALILPNRIVPGIAWSR